MHLPNSEAQRQLRSKKEQANGALDENLEATRSMLYDKAGNVVADDNLASETMRRVKRSSTTMPCRRIAIVETGFVSQV